MASEFEKLKIELSEENEMKFREIFQFSPYDENETFEDFINKWIANELKVLGNL